MFFALVLRRVSCFMCLDKCFLWICVYKYFLLVCGLPKWLWSTNFFCGYPKQDEFLSASRLLMPPRRYEKVVYSVRRLSGRTDPEWLREQGKEPGFVLIVRGWAVVGFLRLRARACVCWTSCWQQRWEHLGFLISCPRCGAEGGGGVAGLESCQQSKSTSKRRQMITVYIFRKTNLS